MTKPKRRKATPNILIAQLTALGACGEAVEAARASGLKNLDEVWASDGLKSEWRVWLATKPGVMSDKDARLFACWCVRQVWHLLTDERSRMAVEVAEAFANGQATQEQLDAARAAAARDAAAWDAAWAAARAAAARDAAAWDAAAWDATWAAQSKQLRKQRVDFSGVKTSANETAGC